MYKKISILTGIALLGLGSLSANAAVIDLFDWGINVDGALTFPGDPLPGGIDMSGFDDISGLGQIDITLTGAGARNALVFLDHEIDEADNSFFNESAATGGALATGQSWEADEPGFLFGDIYDNFMDNTLDNSNGVPEGFEEDVSMAIGWDFGIVAGETAVASFFTSTVNGAAGSFFIEHYDPDSDASIFFWSALDITGGITPPPIDPPPVDLAEPGTFGLALFGMLSAFGLRRRKTQ